MRMHIYIRIDYSINWFQLKFPTLRDVCTAVFVAAGVQTKISARIFLVIQESADTGLVYNVAKAAFSRKYSSFTEIYALYKTVLSD